MRLFLACLTLLPTAAFADSFTLNSAPTSVTVYAGTGKVTREIAFSVPAGRHEVVLPGLPRTIDPATLRVTLDGAVLGATQFRRDAVPPQPDTDSVEIEQAQARIDAAREALQSLDDQVATARLEAEAAEAAARFLSDLGQNEALPTDIGNLRDLAQMIGAETLAAKQRILRAEQEARRINKSREDLENELEDARAALAALTPPAEETAQLKLALDAAEAGDVGITMTYLVGAAWQPVYDVYLAADDLRLQRGAMVSQWSGEAWTDVALTLSTFQLTSQTAPREVFPIPLTFGDKPKPVPLPELNPRAADLAAAPMMQTSAPREEVAKAAFDGPGVSYAVTAPVSIASNVDAVRVALDTLAFDARQFARAAPRYDTTAFLMAGFTNTTQEPLLAADQASLYLDNTLVGSSYFEQIPAGAEAELPFGPIEDLRLSYTVLDQSEGDRGIINKSNARSEMARMDIENIGNQTWQVEVQAAVPYAVQEDLEIDWSASPPPDSRNINDKRGVLQWDSTVPAGTTTQITLRTDLKWPEGKVLR